MATQLDLNYDAQVAAVRSKVSAYAKRLWNGLPAYRDADADRLVRVLVPRVEAGQTKIAQLTDAYIARVVAAEVGGGIVRGDVADVSTEALRGVPAEEVYRRPFVTAYTEIAQGSTMTSAVTAGGARLVSLVETGMQLARTHSALQSGDRTGVQSWSRVLTGRENCALCTLATGQQYNRGDLMPIHGHCDCIVKPSFRAAEQPSVDRLRNAALAELGSSSRALPFADGGGTLADLLSLVTVAEHGETGPTLAWSWQHFTSKEEINL